MNLQDILVMKKSDIELANPGIFLEGFSRYQTAHPKILGGTQKSSNQGAGGGLHTKIQ